MLEGSAPAVGRVLVVDDQAEIRLLVRTRLAMQPEIEVVGEGGDGQEALTLTAALAPDVVVLDRQMPVMRGDEAIPEIRQAAPGVRIVLFTAAATDDLAALPPVATPDSVVVKGTPLAGLVDEVVRLAALARHDVLRIVLSTMPLEDATVAFDAWAGANVRIFEALARSDNLVDAQLAGTTVEELQAVVGVYAHIGDNLRRAAREKRDVVTPVIHMFRSVAAAARRGLVTLSEADLVSFYEAWDVQLPVEALTAMSALRDELIAALPTSSADRTEGGATPPGRAASGPA